MSKDKRRNKYFGPLADSATAEYAVKCDKDTLLPPGIVRISEEAIAAERLIYPEDGIPMQKPVKIAAFDFDGTCIRGSSPKKLVTRLTHRRLLSTYKIFRVGLWGLAYKLNLPKDAEGVRTRVFSAFNGFPAKKVNDYLYRFYHERVDCMYRPEADAEMIAHLEAGHAVVLVSASFEPIIAAAMLEHPIQYALASRMKIDSAGKYTDEVWGLPTEGPEKIVVLRQFADRYFGAGQWELGWAYGDHFSDLEMLSAAEHPCAVTPDSKLRSYAHKHGWSVLDWE